MSMIYNTLTERIRNWTAQSNSSIIRIWYYGLALLRKFHEKNVLERNVIYEYETIINVPGNVCTENCKNILKMVERPHKDLLSYPIEEFNFFVSKVQLINWISAIFFEIGRKKASDLEKFLNEIESVKLADCCDKYVDELTVFVLNNTNNKYYNNLIALSNDIRDNLTSDDIPIIADILEDMEFHNPNVLSHCRQKTHTKACWVIDAILGRKTIITKIDILKQVVRLSGVRAGYCRECLIQHNWDKEKALNELSLELMSNFMENDGDHPAG